jgi:hypothetical protein
MLAIRIRSDAGSFENIATREKMAEEESKCKI